MFKEKRRERQCLAIQQKHVETVTNAIVTDHNPASMTRENSPLNVKEERKSPEHIPNFDDSAKCKDEVKVRNEDKMTRSEWLRRKRNDPQCRKIDNLKAKEEQCKAKEQEMLEAETTLVVTEKRRITQRQIMMENSDSESSDIEGQHVTCSKSKGSQSIDNEHHLDLLAADTCNELQSTLIAEESQSQDSWSPSTEDDSSTSEIDSSNRNSHFREKERIRKARSRRNPTYREHEKQKRALRRQEDPSIKERDRVRRALKRQQDPSVRERERARRAQRRELDPSIRERERIQRALRRQKQKEEWLASRPLTERTVNEEKKVARRAANCLRRAQLRATFDYISIEQAIRQLKRRDPDYAQMERDRDNARRRKSNSLKHANGDTSVVNSTQCNISEPGTSTQADTLSVSLSVESQLQDLCD